MSAIKRINRKVWIVLLIGLVIEVLFDPLSSIIDASESIQARVGLPRARAKWEAQNIAYYSFEISVRSRMCILDARMEVRNEEVVQINLIDLFGAGEVLEEPLPPSEWATSFCNYTNFIVPRFFDELEQSLQYVSRISFDIKYGFISKVHFGSPGGWGLFSPRIFDCCSSFEIDNFQVLDQ